MNSPASKYCAFISYSHRNARVAVSLQRALETYRLPRQLVGTRTGAGEVPPRLGKVFLDRGDLHASADLKGVVNSALTQSRYLIVLCSPDAARSAWVNREIIEFKKLHGESRVLAVIADGEPFAHRAPALGAEECFPEALRRALTPDGQPAGEELEPIAVDLRPQGDGQRRAVLKLAAGMVGVGADELIRRETQRRARRMAFVAMASVAGMAVMSVLTLAAVRARDEAQRQRAQAEDLIEFMLGDLRKKLDPVGRLDALDGVGEKALGYYAMQEPGTLDANSLGRRSRALHLIGELREQRGQLEAAQLAFQRAAETTAQLLALAPRDPQRLYDHAQSVYWVGHLARLLGELPAAERSFREYIRLADRLMQLDPAKLEWQIEAASAPTDLAVMLLETSRATEAIAILTQQLALWPRIVAAQPARAADHASVLGWLARAYENANDFERAVATHKEKIRVLALVPNAATDQQVRRDLRVTNADLARLELTLGRAADAQQFALTAVQLAKALVAVDPQNKTWLAQQYLAQIALAETLHAVDDDAGARAALQEVSAGAAKLLASDAKTVSWQVNLRGNLLRVAAKLARDDERPALIKELTSYLTKMRDYATADRGANQNRDIVIAEAEAQLARLLTPERRTDRAAPHWQAVINRVRPYADQGYPSALTLLATAQFHLGDTAAARALAQRIEATPYRHPAYAELKQLLADGAGPSAAKI